MKRAILLLSGGVDSTVLAHDLAEQGYQLHCVTFRYGQRGADSEIGAASRTSVRVHAHHSVVAFSRNAMGAAAITDHSAVLPESPTTDVVATEPVVVPARNLLFLSSAVSIAVGTGVDHVFVGFTQGDAHSFADCTGKFLQSIGSPLSIVAPGVSVIAPFINMGKADVVRRGEELYVPWSDCYSCYAGKGKQCGLCGACLDRRAAFEGAGVVDVAFDHLFPKYVTLHPPTSKARA